MAKEKKTEVELQVVMESDGKGIRCIYLNDFRIIGGKPWYAENLKRKTYTVPLEDMKSAGFVFKD